MLRKPNKPRKGKKDYVNENEIEDIAAKKRVQDALQMQANIIVEDEVYDNVEAQAGLPTGMNSDSRLPSGGKSSIYSVPPSRPVPITEEQPIYGNINYAADVDDQEVYENTAFAQGAAIAPAKVLPVEPSSGEEVQSESNYMDMKGSEQVQPKSVSLAQRGATKPPIKRKPKPQKALEEDMYMNHDEAQVEVHQPDPIHGIAAQLASALSKFQNSKSSEEQSEAADIYTCQDVDEEELYTNQETIMQHQSAVTPGGAPGYINVGNKSKKPHPIPPPV